MKKTAEWVINSGLILILILSSVSIVFAQSRKSKNIKKKRL